MGATTRMKMRAVLAAMTCGVCLAAGPLAASAETPETDEPIKLAMLEWTGQHIVTRVAGTILEDMGYNVEYVTSGTYTQFTALPDATITASLEVWSSNTGEHYPKAMASGKVEELGDLGLDPIETWYYNAAAGNACPGLPDWRALSDCAQAFATVDTMPQGRFVDYPADWGTTNVNRIEALNLPFTSVPAGSEGALIAEIKGAKAKNNPLLIMFWSPHWVHAVADLTPVKLPPYEDGCYEDASVGVNPDATYDCDWERGYIMKLAHVGLKDKWPGAYKFLKAFTFRNKDQIPLMKAVDVDGEELDTVVTEWINNNKDRWKPWVDMAMN